MKVEPVITPGAVRNRLLRLIATCNSFSLASAWVTRSKVFDAAIAAHRKLRHFVIGTHGYFTCADCLEACIPLAQVKVVKPVGRMFHPKVYAFEMEKELVLYVGSSNFTQAGLDKNVECGVFLRDSNGHENLQSFSEFIAEQWNSAETLDAKFVSLYRANKARVKEAQDELEEFIEIPKPRRTSKSANDVDPIEMDWARFMDLVVEEKTHGGPERRLAVLARARQLLSQGKPFARLSELERRCLAGIQKPSQQPDGLDWGYFGQMSAHGNFSPLLSQHAAIFSSALEYIPLVGTVREQHYEAYRRKLMSIPGAGDWTGLGTRLLAMKRPDRFVCINNANRTGLCGNFGVAKTTTNLSNYWKRIVAPMQLMPWWRAEMPTDRLGRQVWLCRAAMLDAIYYDPTTLRR
ncbi:hypothetical protein C8246_12185 [Paracidovorax avenae]|uniref:Phospholipase D-like domain-containing protein n=2 Tax=Paracidovorax citrulli TaxID=80869 RepID=A1TJP3_PARC0|nr:phospholipase D family protein [Paracidovorax citrulli]AVS92416.1 hypothetical protein C8246_12185 [Paracidovorax avenae]ABM31181.1 hypothetical protein Aave_0577 [Paracidovorax citrulli AAC00-1]ATG95681.1 hypothetical protein CQB05_17940 [Paracidovorax citrulli]MVT29566.1 hypothetical protein [Paracidovorax citrulli]MVT37994.1 hypothetical protein [Paracidovorax citrulli]